MQNTTYVPPMAHEIGLVDGDRILEVGGVKIETIGDIATGILIDNASTLLVERGAPSSPCQYLNPSSQRLLAGR